MFGKNESILKYNALYRNGCFPGGTTLKKVMLLSHKHIREVKIKQLQFNVAA